MEKQLIFEDTNKINMYISSLKRNIPLLQDVIDCTNKMEITPDISEIYMLCLTFNQNNFNETQIQLYVDDYLRGKIVDKMENASIGGVKIRRDKLLEMVGVPDCAIFVNVLHKLQNVVRWSELGGFDLNYYELIDSVVTIKESAKGEISEIYRIYATTEKQYETYLIAKSVADKLNELESKCNSKLYNIHKSELTDIFMFLKIYNSSWSVDSNFIQSLR